MPPCPHTQGMRPVPAWTRNRGATCLNVHRTAHDCRQTHDNNWPSLAGRHDVQLVLRPANRRGANVSARPAGYGNNRTSAHGCRGALGA
eukprot:3130033-Alexandrium_andersonii.AAC.1